MGHEFSTLDEAPLAASGPVWPNRNADQDFQPFAPTGPELLELIADGIVSTDESGTIILFNKAAEALFGYGRAEVLGRPWRFSCHNAREGCTAMRLPPSPLRRRPGTG